MKHLLEEIGLVGLSEAEARARLEQQGPNQLPTSKPKSLARIALDVLREPMLLLLLGCGTIYLILGNKEEALFLLAFVFIVIGITLVQERKTERALEALRDLSSPRALVIREGQERRIPGREVVVGDLVVLSEGDRIPADAVLCAAQNLSIDESLLTGESVPVRKRAGSDEMPLDRPGGDDLASVYSGTLLTSGQGIARVKAIGAATELGKIGAALSRLEPEKTQLEREVRRVVFFLTRVGLAVCALVVVVYGLSRDDWLKGLLAGITLAMAMLPEELPVVLTVFLALGAYRISKHRVLTRRVAALETLGAATVLCTDKTGTLTQNRMVVRKLWSGGFAHEVASGHEAELPEEVHALVEYAILASQRDPFDPMEIAFKELGERDLSGTEHLHPGWTLVREYPLSPELLALSHVWRSPEGQDYIIAAKGAPEAIFDLCHIGEARTQALSAEVKAMAAEGLRVLGVARARFRRGDLPDIQHDFEFELIGLVGLYDPLRPAVPGAIADCHAAGIRVVMITGDYPETARAIACAAGLPGDAELITGPELDAMSDEELGKRIRKIQIFARAVPEQKLRIVSALKAAGEIVAMTGDGVNDAPALKAAHIGVAMGGRGTDVAREAASLVLTDDDFSSIVDAIRLGRRIFENLKKAFVYIFAVHVPIVGMSLLPVLFKWPLVLMPAHIAILQMIIDPACSVVFEAEPAEDGVMQRPPRSPDAVLIGGRPLLLSLLQGVFVLVATMGVFRATLADGEARARTMAFVTLLGANLGLIVINRSWAVPLWSSLRKRNVAMWVMFVGAAALLSLVLLLPWFRRLFGFSLVSAGDLVLAGALAVASVVWFEIYKAYQRAAAAIRRRKVHRE